MTEDSYLVICGKGNCWPIKDKFKSIGGFWNGIFWAFPSQSKSVLSGIIQELPGLYIVEQPLSNGQTFEGHRQLYNAKRYKKRLDETNDKINSIKIAIGIQDLNEQSLDLVEISEEEREFIRKLFHEQEHLTDAIEHAKGLEKVLKQQKSANGSIPPIVSINDRIKSHNELLSLYRGKKYLGLRVKTIEEFNEKMKGLRKLILIAAAPNVGKTALTRLSHF